MKLASRLFAAALCLGLAGQTMAATELKHWPAPAAEQLSKMITANANKGNYAVFDMDNTSYRYDLEESLLPYMENKGLITRDSLDPSLKLMPFKVCSVTTIASAKWTTWSATRGSLRCSRASPSRNSRCRSMS